MLTYSQHRLVDLKHRFRDLTEIAGGRDPQEYRQRIKKMMHMGMHIWIAQDGRRIVGSTGYMPCPALTGITRETLFLDAINKLGIDPATVQVRSLIYTHPAYHGQGIAHELERRTNATSRALGFAYRAAFAYDTENIYSWIFRHDNAVDLGVVDPLTGKNTALVPIDTP